MAGRTHRSATSLFVNLVGPDAVLDLPILLRYAFGNNVSAVDLSKEFVGHVDIPRLRTGKVGGFFWSVYVGCADPAKEGKDFLTSTWRVRCVLRVFHCETSVRAFAEIP